jgi:hypothetical protein
MESGLNRQALSNTITSKEIAMENTSSFVVVENESSNLEVYHAYDSLSKARTAAKEAAVEFPGREFRVYELKATFSAAITVKET